MAKKIAKLLGRGRDRLFDLTLSDLEKATGSHDVDIELSLEIESRGRKIFNELGIDLKDCTIHEAYNAVLLTKKRKIFEDSDFTGILIGESIISLNKNDVEEDRKNNSSNFKNRSVYNMQKSLIEELKLRYRFYKNEHNERQIERLINEL